MLRKYQDPGYKEMIQTSFRGKKQINPRKGSEVRNASDASQQLEDKEQWLVIYCT